MKRRQLRNLDRIIEIECERRESSGNARGVNLVDIRVDLSKLCLNRDFPNTDRAHEEFILAIGDKRVRAAR